MPPLGAFFWLLVEVFEGLHDCSNRIGARKADRLKVFSVAHMISKNFFSNLNG